MVVVVDDADSSAEQRLHDAAKRWTANTRYGPADLIRAAGQALVDGLDSPALRELAGASANDSSHDVARLLAAAFEELRIPEPGTVPLGYAVGAGGDPQVFTVALHVDDDYQVFVDTPWRGRSPEELAREVCHTLAQPPQTWRASWLAIQPRLTNRPGIAGRDWRRYRI